MRVDQLEGLYERWGGTPDTLQTLFTAASPNAVFPWCRSITQGEPLDLDEIYFPAIFLLAPKSSERRGAAQIKLIDYELGIKLVHQAPGDSAVARAPALLVAFYGWLDALGDNVRGLITTPISKILTTQAHPDGLWDATTGNQSIKFGEQFTIDEQHERLETYLVVWASATITSTEQVLA